MFFVYDISVVFIAADAFNLLIYLVLNLSQVIILLYFCFLYIYYYYVNYYIYLVLLRELLYIFSIIT